LFITLEGIEGSGKTTQTDLLHAYFKKKTDRVLCTREPGGTRIGEEIRSILLKTLHTELDALAELCLFIAARTQHVQELISPALLAGSMVICDRFMDASVAYQGFGRGIETKLVDHLNARAVGGCVPDLTILVDCPVEVGLKRTRLRLKENHQLVHEQRFEKEEVSFHRRVREGYLWIADREPERIKVVDGTQPQDKLHEQLVEIILDRFRENGSSVKV